MRDRKLHLPRGFSVPASIAIQTVQDVPVRCIREHWESLLRVSATIDEGWSSATQLLERFGSPARGEEVYRAGTALGQLLRTVYLCDYFTLPEFRREIHRILERGESVHALQRIIHFGSIPVARGRDPAELGVISGALTLVTNAVMTWNAARLQKAVDAEVPQLATMISYVRAKFDWLTGGQREPEPDFGSYARGGSPAPHADVVG